jgi:hypothetical protein
VDDGMLFGDSKHPEFKEARKKLDQVFNMKEWHDLRTGADYLGAQWVQSADGKTITVDMKQFVDKITSTSPSRSEKDDRLLTPSEVTTFRSLLMKLAWPVRQVLPQLAYGVSYLATRVTNANMGDMKNLDALVKQAKELVSTPQGKITFRAIDLDRLVVVIRLRASFAKEEGMKSQAGLLI